MGPDIFHLLSFIKSLYFDSQMTVGILMAQTRGSRLTAEIQPASPPTDLWC
jgi:hypothetical protein